MIVGDSLSFDAHGRPLALLTVQTLTIALSLASFLLSMYAAAREIVGIATGHITTRTKSASHDR